MKVQEKEYLTHASELLFLSLLFGCIRAHVSAYDTPKHSSERNGRGILNKCTAFRQCGCECGSANCLSWQRGRGSKDN